MQWPRSATRGPRSDETPREPLLAWFAGNAGRLTVYLAVTSICLGVLERVVPTDAARLGALAFFFAGGVGGIPGTAVWLVVVSLLPPEWSVGRRRASPWPRVH